MAEAKRYPCVREALLPAGRRCGVCRGCMLTMFMPAVESAAELQRARTAAVVAMGQALTKRLNPVRAELEKHPDKPNLRARAIAEYVDLGRRYCQRLGRSVDEGWLPWALVPAGVKVAWIRYVVDPAAPGKRQRP